RARPSDDRNPTAVDVTPPSAPPKTVEPEATPSRLTGSPSRCCKGTGVTTSREVRDAGTAPEGRHGDGKEHARYRQVRRSVEERFCAPDRDRRGARTRGADRQGRPARHSARLAVHGR